MIFDKTFDIGKRHPNGNIDIPRMREGGLDVLFFSIWVPSEVATKARVSARTPERDGARDERADQTRARG